MSAEAFWLSVLYSIIATIVGGAFLAFIFFLVREKICPPPDVAGQWFMEVKTEKSAYNPYEEMTLRYVVMLWREGNKIKGTSEKIYANSIKGEETYVGKNRSRSTIGGVVEKNYFSKDRILVHSIERGTERESTTLYQLICTSKKFMEGKFWSTVADQTGKVVWQRNPFE
jgi:hypothetical protein